MKTYLFEDLDRTQAFVRRLNSLDEQCHRAIKQEDGYWKVSIFPVGDSDLVEKIQNIYSAFEEGEVQRINAEQDEVRDEEEI